MTCTCFTFVINCNQFVTNCNFFDSIFWRDRFPETPNSSDLRMLERKRFVLAKKGS